MSVSIYRTEDYRARAGVYTYVLAREVPGRLCGNALLLFEAGLELISMRCREGWIFTYTLKSGFLKEGPSLVKAAAPECPAFTVSSSNSISNSILSRCEEGYTAVNRRHKRRTKELQEYPEFAGLVDGGWHGEAALWQLRLHDYQ